MPTKRFYCTKDAFMGKGVSSGFSGWNGKDDHLPVGLSQSGTFKFRSLIYFSISFSGMDSIDSATLYLSDYTTGDNIHAHQGSTTSSLNIRRMTSDWGEGSADPGEGNLTSSLAWDWDNRHDDVTSAGERDINIGQGSNGQEHAFGVTSIVRDWFDGEHNYGIMLRNNSETSISKGLQFWSRNVGGTNRPYIDIEYTTNEAPNAPVNLVPDETIVNTLTPNLSGTRSDPDSGDSISAVQVKVNGPIGLFRWSTSTSGTDPGSGYIRGSSSPVRVYVSETDKTGASIVAKTTDILQATDLWIVARTDPSRWWKFTDLVGTTDNGTWDTIEGFELNRSSEDLIADEEVYLMADNPLTLMWDSAAISLSGTPSVFSVTYGSTGTATPLRGNVIYLWKGRTRDKGLLWGPYSTTQVFKANSAPSAPTVTVLESPITDIKDNTPEFSIKHNDSDIDDQKMYAYQVVVGRESGGLWSTAWDSGAISVTPSETITLSSAALVFGGHYRVSARTQDSSGVWGNYSSGIEFYVHKAGAPVNLAPSGGGSSGVTPTFTGDSAYAADVITAYTIKVYTADQTTAMLAATRYTTGITGGGTGFNQLYAGAGLTPGNSYVWSAKVETDTGDESVYSLNQTFFVVDATYPSITSPLGSNSWSLTPTISGQRDGTFNRFKYEIYPSTSTDASLGTVIYASGVLSATISGSNPTTFSVAYGGSPALTFATTYRLRVAVSADGGSSWSGWSGLASFTTDSASIGTPQSPAHGDWITDSTPDFYINRGGSDTIDQMQVRVWNATDTAIIWDSGMTDVTNGTSNVGPITYAGTTALVGGTTYHWDFRYKKTGGATGGYSQKYAFRLNGGPTAPTNRFPSPGESFADTLLPTFRSKFGDPELTTNNDYPTKWSIRITDEDDVPLVTKEITSSLSAGDNEYVWQSGDYGFSYSTDYHWQDWYTDSKGATGAYSALSTFRMGVSPNATINNPTNGSNISDISPNLDWSYTGGTQQKYRVRVFQTDAFGVRGDKVYDSDFRTSAATTFTVPAGYIKDKKYYDIQLDVISTDNLSDPSPSVVNVHVVQHAPNAITGLSMTTAPTVSRVDLNWDTWAVEPGHTFKYYRIERRLVGDETFRSIGIVTSRTTSEYTDWYAGHDIDYEWRVTVNTYVASDDAVIESPDDDDGGNLVTGKLVADIWMFIGADRSVEHTQELYVNEESHNRPVQQEAFETLGSNRKVIIRGFVLGNEGSISMMYSGSKVVASPTDPQVFYPETILGRRLVDYLTFNKGPHILKSPFGDVWDVEFAGPEYQWLQGGHLRVDLSWIETGSTSREGFI